MARQLQVEVRGSGIAASCCEILLARRGIGVSSDSRERPRVPGILLSPGTQELLLDVFKNPDLLCGLKQIRRRVVSWGQQSPVTLPHSGLIVSEVELLKRIGSNGCSSIDDQSFDWIIHTGGPPPQNSANMSFGNRTTTATRVRLAANADPEACVIESGSEGWLFLLPTTDDDTALLLSAGSPATRLLGDSRLVQSSTEAIIAELGTFPSHPRVLDPLNGPRWLACGSAAIGFDPLCGDGAGHAVREAILACAVIADCNQNIEQEELLWEYRLRLWRGFRRHLELCLQFYETGGTGEWWRFQVSSLREGVEWLSKREAPYELGRLQLKDFALQKAAD